MKDLDALFARRRVSAARLLSFGFVEDKGAYFYSEGLLDGEFEMVVTVARGGQISAEVIDRSSGERYVLHRIPGATGAFVGRIRDEYEHVLARIAQACFDPDVFKSAGARQVIQYAKDRYAGELEFLWERFPDNAILRRQDSAKWYAALLTVQKKKLGLDAEGAIEILNVRMKPEDVSAWVDGKKYLPGYHMNKKHWATICLDDSVPLQEICRRIDESFALAAK
jgi:predicted DNA-binding protein (MmcQ/YjbR family)